jgi:hypothetical protein
MSKKHRDRRASQEAGSSALTMAQTPALQETTVVAPQQEVPEKTEATQEAPQGLTAKQMAQMEELNQVRALKIAAQAAEPPPPPAPSITDVVSKGYDALHEQFRLHAERNKPKEYVPPPRTARQMSQLEEELEAGRRAVERAQRQQQAAQEARAAAALAEQAKEGFTTPVYRPGDAVPNPVTGKLGTFGKDA